MGIRLCPNCGGKVSSSRNDCIHCGYVFPVTKKCPDCEEEVDISVQECPVCGYPFVVNTISTQPETPPITEETTVVLPSDENAKPSIIEEQVVAPIEPPIIETTYPQQETADRVVCPYCGSDSLMEIGIDFYMCNICKGRLLNTGAIVSVPTLQDKVSFTSPVIESSADIKSTTDENKRQENTNKNFVTYATKSEDDIGDKTKSFDNSPTRQKAPRKKLSVRFWVAIALSVVLMAAIPLSICLPLRARPLKYKLDSSGEYYIVESVNYRKTEIVIPETHRGKPVKEIGEGAFRSNLTSVVIGDNVTSIGSSAFSDCSSLTRVVIGNSVESIGNGAFNDCDSLTSIVIPDSVTSIGDHAFDRCYSLTSVIIGESVESIGNNAFYDCKALETINFNAIACEDLSSGVFKYAGQDGDGITVTFGDNVTKIPAYVFSSCDSLTSVVIGDNVTSIGSSAFSHCDSLTSVVIGESVESIGNDAFYSCDSLTSVVIPDNVTSIGSSAFNYCSSLTSVVIGDNVTSIGIYAFAYCDSLTRVVIGNSVESIGNDAFYSCDSLTSVVIPDNVTSIGSSAFNYCSSLTSVVIGDNVTSIGNDAFYSCDSLTSVVIPDSVTRIGNSAFALCYSLTSVIIGESVAGIGSNAFNACYKLVEVINKSTHITVGKGSSSNGCIGYYALAVYNSGDTFTGTKLSNDNDYIIYTDGNEKILVNYIGKETDLILPNYITKINDDAFSSCDSLTSVVIGDNVTSIGSSAFSHCDSLTSIKYRGSQEQWNAIVKGSDWDFDTGAYIITYNYKGN